MDIDATIGNDVTMRGGGSSSLGRIDQYELLRELGGGGFGCVFLAKDTVAGIEVAVKGLPPEVKHNKEELENIRANFALVSRLHHPNIAAALVLHPAKEVSYANRDTMEKLRVFERDTMMVMEYAPGVTLSQWRKQFSEKKVPLDKALDITRQVAAALDYAHGAKIVHRDVKPSNVMIETKPDGSVVARVLDFGLAAEIRSSMGRVSREIRDTSGTRPYMAPEQWRGAKQGPATDQYALAAMFCELVTGEVPFASVFETGDPVVMLTNVTTLPPELPDSLPRGCRKALLRALAKKPEERFGSCTAFADALGYVDSGASAGKTWIVAVLLVVLGLAVVGGWWWREKVKSEELRVKNEALAAERARQAEEVRRAEEVRKLAEDAKRKAEEARIAAEKAEAEGRAKLEAERVLAEKRRTEENRIAAEKADVERKAKAESGRLAEEKRKAEVERMRLAAEKKAEEDRLARDEAERKARKAEQLAKERREKEEQSRIAAEAETKERLLADRLRRAPIIGTENGLKAGVTKSVTLPDGKSMTFVWCPPGLFMMGSPRTESDRIEGAEKEHVVKLTKGFWIGQYEVTKGQWQSVMKDGSVGWFDNEQMPKTDVSWGACRRFLERMGTCVSGARFRLPTEAEWEWACRAGTMTPFSFGSVLNGNQACCNGSDPYGTDARGPHALTGPCTVGSFPAYANAWGICDMHGNVYEWCEDGYASYPDGPVTDPLGEGEVKVIRGGCWNYAPRQCRSAFRNRMAADSHNGMIGFRACCSELP